MLFIICIFLRFEFKYYNIYFLTADVAKFRQYTITISPLNTGGHFHCYRLDKSICHFFFMENRSQTANNVDYL